MSTLENPPDLRWVTRGVLVITYLAVVVTVASCWGARWSWWLDVASNFRVQLVWILLILSGLLLLLRQALHAVLAGLTSLLLALTLVPLYWTASQTPDAPHDLRVLAINVLSLNRDFEEVTAMVEQEDPDVVIALEVTSDWVVAFEELKHKLPHSASAPSDGHCGIAIYSRLPLSDCHFLELADHGVGAVSGTVVVEDQEVCLLGVHVLPPLSFELSQIRNRQLREIARLSAKSSRPTIVAGDLNTTNWSPYFQDLCREGNLRDTRLGYGILPSHQALPLLQITLDHVLVSPGIGVRRRWVVPCRGSDHDAVAADLSL